MSEKLHHAHEKEHGHENAQEAEKRSHEIMNERRLEAARAAEQHSDKRLEEIREQVETHVEKTDTHKEAATDEEPETANAYWFSQEYRSVAYRQILTRTQQHLSKPQKALSKIIHQPTIERLSDVGSKTIARPSGVLIGSVFSFVSSIVVYTIAKRNGYDMTYSIIALSFVGGFIVGLLVEFGYRLTRTLLARD